MRLNSVARIARNCTASMRFKGGSAKSSLNLIDGFAPGIASLKTTRSEAEARPHCKLARISPADRLDPHLNFVTPISPVCANSLCQILRAFPVNFTGSTVRITRYSTRKPRHVRWGGFLFFAPCSGVWGGWALTTLDAERKIKFPSRGGISLS